MRLSVCLPIFFRGNAGGFAEGVRRSAALGFDAVEMWGWKDVNLEELRDACKESGVEMTAICTSNFALTEPEKRAEYLECLKESCEAAHILGASQLITQSGMDTGASRESQHESIVEGLSACAPILKAEGITLVLEPLNTLVNHPGIYLSTTAESIDILKAVDSPNVRLLYDIYHQQITEGNIIYNLTSNIEYIAHLHAAGVPGRHEMVGGENDYAAIFRAADEAGYKGVCGLEYSPLLPAEESLQQVLDTYGNTCGITR